MFAEQETDTWEQHNQRIINSSAIYGSIASGRITFPLLAEFIWLSVTTQLWLMGRRLLPSGCEFRNYPRSTARDDASFRIYSPPMSSAVINHTEILFFHQTRCTTNSISRAQSCYVCARTWTLWLFTNAFVNFSKQKFIVFIYLSASRNKNIVTFVCFSLQLKVIADSNYIPQVFYITFQRNFLLAYYFLWTKNQQDTFRYN